MVIFTLQCHLKIQNNMAANNQKIHGNCKKCFCLKIYLLCPWNDLYMTLSWPWNKPCEGLPQTMSPLLPRCRCLRCFVTWSPCSTRILLTSFCTDVSASTEYDIRGDGCYKRGYHPSKPHIVTIPPWDACWKASQPQYVNCSLVEHSFATKTYGNCKYVFIQYYSWFDPEMTLIWPWPDPAVEPQQRVTPAHVTFSTQVWVPQVLCDLGPVFHTTLIDHFLHWFYCW